MSRTSICRLNAETGEAIDVRFDPVYRPATPGSSAWTIIAPSVVFMVRVPKWAQVPSSYLLRFRARISEPNCVVKQSILLQPVSDRLYVGDSNFPIYMQAGSYGRINRFRQYLMIDRLYHGFDEDEAVPFISNPLRDPINGTGLFQINMFEASPYALTNIAIWQTL